MCFLRLEWTDDWCIGLFILQNSSCSSNSSANSFDKEKTNLNYLIDDLEAYTKYNITVTAYTEKGEGNATSIEAQTNVIGRIQSFFSASSKNSIFQVFSRLMMN